MVKIKKPTYVKYLVAYKFISYDVKHYYHDYKNNSETNSRRDNKNNNKNVNLVPYKENYYDKCTVHGVVLLPETLIIH